MRNPDLNGTVPDTSAVAVLLIDVINDFDYVDGDKLFQHARLIAPNIAQLKHRARQAQVPVIYVNDNFGRWHSNFRAQLEHCLDESCLGRDIAQMLHPDEKDYFVLKTSNSGFYCTALEVLLLHLQTTRLVIAGLAGNICVLYTASDAYMRKYDLIIAGDCTASNTTEENEWALQQIGRYMHGRIQNVDEIDFANIKQSSQLRWPH